MVVMLTDFTGEPFAIGLATYLYQPATERETLPRIKLRVELDGLPVIAVVDTGAPYVLCPPRVADEIGVNRTAAISPERLLIRGASIDGHLYRLPLKFRAEQGVNVEIDATVFVPSPEWENAWGDLPAFIGLTGCLERIRFAIDPRNDLFYFGPL